MLPRFCKSPYASRQANAQVVIKVRQDKTRQVSILVTRPQCLRFLLVVLLLLVLWIQLFCFCLCLCSVTGLSDRSPCSAITLGWFEIKCWTRERRRSATHSVLRCRDDMSGARKGTLALQRRPHGSQFKSHINIVAVAVQSSINFLNMSSSLRQITWILNRPIRAWFAPWSLGHRCRLE